MTIREGLTEVITSNIMVKNNYNLSMKFAKELARDLERTTRTSTPKKANVEPHEVWAYIERYGAWDIRNYKTVDEAIQQLASNLYKTTIVYAGEVLEWDTLESNKAFYIDPISSKIKLVDMGDYAEAL